MRLRRLFYYIKPDLHYFIVAFIAVLFSAFTILLFGGCLSSIIAAGAEYDFTTKLVIIILIALAVSFTSFIRLYFIGIGSEKVIARIRYDLYCNIIDLQPSFFENTGIQDVISALTTDISVLQNIINSSLLTISRNFIILIGSVIMLLYTDLYLTAYTSIIVPILLIIIIFIGKKVRNHARSTQSKLSELASFSEESFRSILTIKSFVSEKNEKARFKKYLNSVSESYIRLIFFRTILVTLVISCLISSVVILISFGIKEVISNNITIGDLSSFIFYSALAAGAINNLSDNVSDLQRGIVIVDRLFEFKNIKSSITDPDSPIKIYNVQKGILFKGVTFFYKSRPGKPVLNNVSFSIEAGQAVSIVGPSGSGKSTVLKLLLRFDDPDKGSITIDGYSIKSIALSNLRSLFGLVPQDYIIFSCSIMENILYGKPDAEYEEVKQAAINAYAIEFIEKLPDKFSTFIGKRGLKLSEGQKQRLVIARAILKNPQVLVLDEATSALDYRSENCVQKALGKLMQNRTTIIITHRLSTALKTDKIVLINHGKVEEVGTHESLISKDGLYSKLIKVPVI